MAGFLRRQLTDEERESLQRWLRSEHKVKYLRARIVLMAETTPNAAVIARAIGVHVQTVRDLARTFRLKGPAGLEPKLRPGRPRKFAGKAADTLVELLHEPPGEHGGDDGRWTLQAAAVALARRLEVNSVSVETVRQLLKRRRLSWQRTKEWIESPDPAYAVKKSGATA